MGVFSDVTAAIAMLFGGKTKTEELPNDISFAGKTVLITGATTGLGFESAIHYLNLDAFKVIITARTLEKGEMAKGEMIKRTGKENIEVMTLNMDSLEGVKKFVKQLQERVTRIDNVLLNAGVHDFEYIQSPDGWQTDLQVNVLSTVLIAVLLIPWMRKVKTGPQHLGFTSSTSHLVPDISTWPEAGVLNFSNAPENFVNAFYTYERSKLLLEYAIQGIIPLATEADGTPNPIINSVCPGRIRSNIGHKFAEDHPFLAPIYKIWLLVGSHPTDVGARSLVKLGATGPEEHGVFKTPVYSLEELKAKRDPRIESTEGKRMQKQVWKEVLDILINAAPELKGYFPRKVSTGLGKPTKQLTEF